ncbi:MAG TPA: hypothetical protein DDW42_08010 [Desulfobacteraceae bacterium]|nr:hypothetical protein [Desulfobacteraceae bacterium]
MCLILLSLKAHPIYKFILAANRDEYYDRPTASAGFWDDAPYLLAGRDLRSGGTWLGITKGGKIAALTNYRDPASNKGSAPSRGELTKNYLMGRKDPSDYLADISQDTYKYNGFSLILGGKDNLYLYSNREDGLRLITPGIHCLSNHLIDRPWPKVVRAKESFKRLLSEEGGLSPEDLFSLLKDRHTPEDKSLPDTGIGLEWERVLSPIFIESPTYGTRSSTILLIDLDNHATFFEKTFSSDSNNGMILKYEFQIKA